MRGGLILSSSAAAAPDGDIRESLGDGAVSSQLLAKGRASSWRNRYIFSLPSFKVAKLVSSSSSTWQWWTAC